jgi:hypothetical protein
VTFVDVVEGRWQVEQVFALAPRPNSIAAAQPLAVPTRWVATGCDHQGVWGRCVGSGAEPYDVVVDHTRVRMHCACASRVRPCKHSLALLLLWARGQVAQVASPSYARTRLEGWAAVDESSAVPASSGPPSAAAPAPTGAGSAGTAPSGTPPTLPDPSGRDERVARMMAGLVELDRWLDDRMRTGLADPALAQYRTWDQLAARLVDAQVGALSNRVRRLAGLVGAGPDWHQHVLAELGMLHLLADAGRHLGTLPPGLADAVGLAIGWQIRQADVLAGVPSTDEWVVMGRSDVREDRIEVRRTWLRGRRSGQWAMVLSFAAYRQTLDASFTVGTAVHADLFRYPGALALRALAGPRHSAPEPALDVEAGSVAQAVAEVGRCVALEPWVDRLPVCLRAAPTRAAGRWVLTDTEGSLPIAPGAPGIAALLACSEGRPVPVTAEWTPYGLVPLTVHLTDRAVDIGPVADSSFVGASA